jgi:hypothetical protein
LTKKQNAIRSTSFLRLDGGNKSPACRRVAGDAPLGDGTQKMQTKSSCAALERLPFSLRVRCEDGMSPENHRSEAPLRSNRRRSNSPPASTAATKTPTQARAKVPQRAGTEQHQLESPEEDGTAELWNPLAATTGQEPGAETQKPPASFLPRHLGRPRKHAGLQNRQQS